MAIKSKSHEKLTDTNIKHVISLLEAENPITKKEACEILNIRYNTTRLQKILDDWRDTVEFRERRRSMNKGKPASADEIKMIAQMYIEGFNISSIAQSIYRSPAFVKSVVERIGIPMKLPSTDYDAIRNAMLPEQCVAESFQEGEIVWAIRKNFPAKIIREHTNMDYEKEKGSKCYLIYTIEENNFENTFFPHLQVGGQYSSQLAYDLGSLRHLEQYGVKFT